MMHLLSSSISDYRKYRLLEVIPGLMVWATLILSIGLSFIAPIWVMYFIIAYDLFWLFRILYMFCFMIISYSRFRKTLRINWLERIRSLPGWERYYQLVFIPTYKEPYEVLRDSFSALKANRYPLDKMIIVFAGEEKDKDSFLEYATRIQKEFGASFFKILVTVHPSGVAGEVAGKGSNIAWAGRKAREFIDQLHIPYENVIVSSFDSDTCVHPDYFTYLTYTYATHPNPTRASYQPLALFNNNVWDSPALTRVISYSTTFWLMTEQLRPERMFTFSSHSMSFKALVDVDFWQSDIVTEDSRICLQCMMEYDGDYEVVPLYMPVSMDVVLGKTFRETIKAQYVQQRRWAYGVENFPYMVWNFGRNKRMPLIKKIRYIFNQLEGVYSWATAPILIFILGRLPIWVANHRQLTSVVTQNTPDILQVLMTAAMVGIIIQAAFSTSLLPPRPAKHSKMKLFSMIIQWVLVPVTLIVFGSIPAIEAQTRLMLGKYLGFHVTAKVRK
ncbi:MAG: glycosyltransferase family 2 protein [Patescibacteria group bacterium]|nr:glycosyltransferase family 2 protein [Patescibacteria group bacterium]